MMDHEELKKIWGEKSIHDYPFMNKIIGQQNLGPNAPVLDIGTGWGAMAINLALNGFDVITGEPDEWQKNHRHRDPGSRDRHGDWKEMAEKLDVTHKIKYQPLNAESLTFSREFFDGVFLYNSLHHIPDKIKAISECARVVKPAGVICIFEMNEAGNTFFRKNHSHDHPLIDPREFIGENQFRVDVDEGPYTNAYILKKK